MSTAVVAGGRRVVVTSSRLGTGIRANTSSSTEHVAQGSVGVGGLAGFELQFLQSSPSLSNLGTESILFSGFNFSGMKCEMAISSGYIFKFLSKEM